MNSDSPNFVIFGTGAMASLFGSYLSKIDSINLSLFGSWQQQIKALQNYELKVTHLDESVSLHKINATCNINELSPVDFALVLVKSHQTKKTAEQAYADNKKAKLDPLLISYFPETHGVLIYQEQVIKVAHEVGGLSLVEADQTMPIDSAV